MADAEGRGMKMTMKDTSQLPASILLTLAVVAALVLGAAPERMANAAGTGVLWEGHDSLAEAYASLSQFERDDDNAKESFDQPTFNQTSVANLSGEEGSASGSARQNTTVTTELVGGVKELRRVSTTGRAQSQATSMNFGGPIANSNSEFELRFEVQTEIDYAITFTTEAANNGSDDCARSWVDLRPSNVPVFHREKRAGLNCGPIPENVGPLTGTLEPDVYTLSAQALSELNSDEGTSTGSASYSLTLQLTGACTIVGTPGDDVLDGTGGDDVMCGLGGKDTLRGRGGWDMIRGGPGRDQLFGGSGRDTIRGGPKPDKIFGDEDDDRLYGDGGRDLVCGDEGNDVIFGGDGSDAPRFDAKGGLIGGGGSDRIEGDANDDYIIGGNKTVAGCPHSGTDLGSPMLNGGPGNDDIAGSVGDDTIIGSTGDDAISGGPGSDRIQGSEGWDVICGGPGDDKLLEGGADRDTIAGGGGSDRILGASLASDSDDDDVIHGGLIENLVGLYSNGGTVTVKCGHGEPDEGDNINAGGGLDAVRGQEGADTIRGGPDVDSLHGDGGGDTIYARDQEQDDIKGGTGADRAQVDEHDTLQSVETLF